MLYNKHKPTYPANANHDKILHLYLSQFQKNTKQRFAHERMFIIRQMMKWSLTPHLRILSHYLRKRLICSGDIESNPGPCFTAPRTRSTPLSSGKKIRIITQNCRGLNEHKKLKLTLNNSHKSFQHVSHSIIALQETMITHPDNLNVGWRGNYVFTPGTGHGRGCVTLISHELHPLDITHIRDRGHVFTVNLNEDKLIIANLYAPTGQNNDKIEFFNEVKRVINSKLTPGDNIILLGDLNTVFEDYECKHRSFLPREKRIAASVKRSLEGLSLTDCWEAANDNTTHTWRKGKQSSRLDRIMYLLDNCKQTSCNTDWTFTNSDHAAVIVEIELREPKGHTSANNPRLDSTKLKNPRFKEEFITRYLDLTRETPTTWTPHTTLEFHKCMIRTAYQDSTQAEKLRINSNFDNLKFQLHSLIETAENSKDVSMLNRLQEKINLVRAKITLHNNELGERLAEKLKTKWYNEGERSNKYFLGILKRRSNEGQLNELTIEGTNTKDKATIEKQVLDFYTNLYNQNKDPTSQEDLDAITTHLPELNQLHKDHALRQITVKDLEQTLKESKDSAPGPDGIPYAIIKAVWPRFSNILIDSWKFSRDTHCLPPSHNQSVLKLIPKAGKNLKDIKNWRPITLSNCDHKLITKTLSRLLTRALDTIITGNQTAYIRNRSISDNLRVLTAALKSSKIDTNLKGLIIALDAKKAFDSVSHNYIRHCLTKVGLAEFVPTFNLLYNDQNVDIDVNGTLIKGYKIGNGVKQGDSLSCILFVLAMEPLIRNIEQNQNITHLESNMLRIAFPKCLGYADDITVLCADSIRNLREVIKEYEKFTKASGLELNADKTELFRINTHRSTLNYRFTYLDNQIILQNTEQIVLNGIIFTHDLMEMRQANYDAARDKLIRQFQAWSNRRLTILGKILIYKTFGLSQLIYKSRVITWSDEQNKQLRNEIYKFIWNTNYEASKAPDRIAREKLLTPQKYGGFGMVDHEEIIAAMNCKQTMQNLISSHPIRDIILRATANNRSLIKPKIKFDIDGPTRAYCHLTGQLFDLSLNRPLEALEQDAIAQRRLLNENLKTLTLKKYQNSIQLFILNRNGLTKLRDIITDPAKTESFIRNLSDNKYVPLIRLLDQQMRVDDTNEHSLFLNGRYKHFSMITSKTIRLEVNQRLHTITPKINVDQEDLTWFCKKLGQIKCTRLRNLALRVIHGDIYTKKKLHEKGLIDEDVCDKCGQQETLDHLLYECWYSGRVWNRLIEIYRLSERIPKRYTINVAFVLGANIDIHKPRRLLHLEIIRNLTIKDRPTMLPNTLIKTALNYLIICEKEPNSKRYLTKLRRQLDN